jgi:ADP-heptose:LPS heptosyltransferase
LKVIFINTSNIGDLVSSIGFAKKISENFSEAFFFTRDGHQDIFLGESWVKTISKEDILKLSFEYLYDFSSSKVSRKIVKIVNAKNKIGFSKNMLDSIFSPYSETKKRKSKHIVKSYAFNDELQIPQLENLENKNNNDVAIHIGARNPIRNIPIFIIKEIIRFLAQKNKRVYIFGDSKDELENLEKEFDITIFTGTLFELKKLLSKVSLFIGSDSGPLHIATALKTDSIGFFGPNIPENSAPLQNISIVEKELECRPCNQNMSCPIDVKCLKTLSFKKDVKPFLETYSNHQ